MRSSACSPPRCRGCATSPHGVRPIAPAPWTPLFREHFDAPRNVGDIAGAEAAAAVTDPERSDTLVMSFRIAGGQITEARFRAIGCPVTVAAGSWATEALRGRTVAEALALRDDDVARALGGLDASEIRRSVLVERVIAAALARFASGDPDP